MGSFVVFLSDSEDLNAKLKELAEKEKINNTVLSIDNPAGPKGYKVSKDADVRPGIFDLAKTHGWTLYELHQEAASLEEVFRQLTAGPEQS